MKKLILSAIIGLFYGQAHAMAPLIDNPRQIKAGVIAQALAPTLAIIAADTTTLRVDLTAETAARIAADLSLGVDTTTLRADLSAETAARLAADLAISVDTTTLGADLSAETAARIAADLAISVDTTTISSNLTAETLARIAADLAISVDTTTIAGDLVTEAAARAAGDLSLSVDTTTIAGDLVTETAARAAGDLALSVDTTTIAGDLVTETAARVAADLAISIDTTAIAGNLATEISNRQAGDAAIAVDTTSIAGDLVTETAARIAADLAIAIDTSTLETDKLDLAGGVMTGPLTVSSFTSLASLKIADGTQSNGYYLQSDANGETSWAAVSAGGEPGFIAAQSTIAVTNAPNTFTSASSQTWQGNAPWIWQTTDPNYYAFMGYNADYGFPVMGFSLVAPPSTGTTLISVVSTNSLEGAVFGYDNHTGSGGGPLIQLGQLDNTNTMFLFGGGVESGSNPKILTIDSGHGSFSLDTRTGFTFTNDVGQSFLVNGEFESTGTVKAARFDLGVVYVSSTSASTDNTLTASCTGTTKVLYGGCSATSTLRQNKETATHDGWICEYGGTIADIEAHVACIERE